MEGEDKEKEEVRMEAAECPVRSAHVGIKIRGDLRGAA